MFSLVDKLEGNLFLLSKVQNRCPLPTFLPLSSCLGFSHDLKFAILFSLILKLICSCKYCIPFYEASCHSSVVPCPYTQLTPKSSSCVSYTEVFPNQAYHPSLLLIAGTNMAKLFAPLFSHQVIFSFSQCTFLTYFCIPLSLQLTPWHSPSHLINWWKTALAHLWIGHTSFVAWSQSHALVKSPIYHAT